MKGCEICVREECLLSVQKLACRVECFAKSFGFYLQSIISDE